MRVRSATAASVILMGGAFLCDLILQNLTATCGYTLTDQIFTCTNNLAVGKNTNNWSTFNIFACLFYSHHRVYRIHLPRITGVIFWITAVLFLNSTCWFWPLRCTGESARQPHPQSLLLDNANYITHNATAVGRSTQVRGTGDKKTTNTPYERCLVQKCSVNVIQDIQTELPEYFKWQFSKINKMWSNILIFSTE